MSISAAAHNQCGNYTSNRLRLLPASTANSVESTELAVRGLQRKLATPRRAADHQPSWLVRKSAKVLVLLNATFPDGCRSGRSSSSGGSSVNSGSSSVNSDGSASSIGSSALRNEGVAKLAQHRLLVSIPHRLIFCPIEKVALHQFAQLFLALTGKPCRDSFGSLAYAQMHRELPSASAFPPPLVSAVLSCARWTKLLVVRDPLERLLSAFLDKCVHADVEHRALHCLNFRGPLRKVAIWPRERARPPPPSFAAFVQKLTLMNLNGDRHFNLQRNFCQLKPQPSLSPHLYPPADPRAEGMLPRYVVIRMSEPRTFTADLDAALRRVGVDLAYRRAFLPERSIARHRTGAAQQMRRYYTRSLATRALRLYKGDYDAFRLPMPNLSEFAERL